jgi:hypothetical protein
MKISEITDKNRMYHGLIDSEKLNISQPNIDLLSLYRVIIKENEPSSDIWQEALDYVLEKNSIAYELFNGFDSEDYWVTIQKNRISNFMNDAKKMTDDLKKRNLI